MCQRSFGCRLVVEREGVEMPAARADMRARPGRLGDPASRTLGIEALRRHMILHPDAQHGLAHDAGVGALQPVIPPAQRLLQEADGGTRYRLVTPAMAPGADQ